VIKRYGPEVRRAVDRVEAQAALDAHGE